MTKVEPKHQKPRQDGQTAPVVVISNWLIDGWMVLSVSVLKIKQRLSFASAHPLALRHHEFSHAAVSFCRATQKKSCVIYYKSYDL